MKKASLPSYRNLGSLSLVERSNQSVRLQARTGVVELCVLAPDLFRLRMTSRKALSERPSWAVVKQEWEPLPVKISSSQKSVSLVTGSGRLTLDIVTGQFLLVDVGGNELLSSVPNRTGFSDQGCELALSLAEDDAIFGLGETTGTFNKRGLVREFWNIDVLGHAPAIHPSLRTLYLSIPFAMLLRNGIAAGVFWDNPARQIWDLGQTRLDEWHMKAALGEIDLYLFLGPSMKQVLSRYTELTGRIPLPPKWALGNQQCRYSYETRDKVEEIAREFRRRKIPCDAIYLDIHHMDEYRVFTFGKSFPEPASMARKLAKQGFKLITIVDPGVKDDRNFGVLKRGTREKAFVKAPSGNADFVGRVWPGESRFPDFLNERTRQWWGKEQDVLFKTGVAGLWNDMNEPANFALPSKTLPEDCSHENDFGRISHAEAHNLYGMQMARASREGALRSRPGSRPFIITRAGYAGVQRYALVWTGDNSSIWEHLGDSLQMCLNLSLSGVPFCGADVGGFVDNATPELLARWTQMAVFMPFLRNHSNIRTVSQEPWALGDRTESICRRFIELRYQLLPYLYCLFAEAHQRGTPIIRPLAWNYQNDPVALRVSDQFMLGSEILVAPIMRQGAVARSVYLPGGTWYEFFAGIKHEGGRHVVGEATLETMPLYVRSGALIPMGPVTQYIDSRTSNADVANLHLWPGGRGKLTWYEDDGQTQAYEKGEFAQRDILWEGEGRRMRLRFGNAVGSFRGGAKRWRIILREMEKEPQAKSFSSRISIKYNSASRVAALEIPNSPQQLDLEFTIAK